MMNMGIGARSPGWPHPPTLLQQLRQLCYFHIVLWLFQTLNLALIPLRSATWAWEWRCQCGNCWGKSDFPKAWTRLLARWEIPGWYQIRLTESMAWFMNSLGEKEINSCPTFKILITSHREKPSTELSSSLKYHVPFRIMISSARIKSNFTFQQLCNSVNNKQATYLGISCNFLKLYRKISHAWMKLIAMQKLRDCFGKVPARAAASRGTQPHPTVFWRGRTCSCCLFQPPNQCF